ncbi:DUF1501 domain-containing protein [Planctomycetales bacterium 10988]|nr:DUF1501 domain-containing protein [Planctomycetales bacterium 10988]
MRMQRHLDLEMRRGRVVCRRDFLKSVSAAGTLAAGSLGFRDLVTLKAEELRKEGMACILLWMQGGPSQFDTFTPKPDHTNGAGINAIRTNIPGIHIAENLPNVARQMDKLAVMRSLTNKEGNHLRATYQLHTGYVLNASIKHPTLGSLVSNELGDPECEIPSFVRIGGRGVAGGDAGILGVEYNPFVLNSPERPPENTELYTSAFRHRRRLGLMDRLEAEGPVDIQAAIHDHRKVYHKASKMILSPQMEAFEVDQEPDYIQQGYGRGQFAKGCLLARRLIETGVTFVEVSLGNWDTHQDNNDRTKDLTDQLDQPFAYLLEDLEQRGMLDKTLVIWMGEFGRTPKINARGGRDHFPAAFNAAIAGAGVRGGQVIGETESSGQAVSDRPIEVPDLFRSFFHALKLDADKENMSAIGRPLPLVEGGTTVEELFG